MSVLQDLQDKTFQVLESGSTRQAQEAAVDDKLWILDCVYTTLVMGIHEECVVGESQVPGTGKQGSHSSMEIYTQA